MFLLKFNSNRFILHVTLAVLLFSSSHILGQQNKPLETSEKIMVSIFEDVWQPFMKSYRNQDLKKFKSIHAKNLTRVSISRNQIQSSADYFTEMEGFFKQLKESGRKIDIRFSIVSFATDGAKTYQTGYYCFSSKGSDSEVFEPRGYGFFNVLLIKEGGRWKISIDADKQSTIDEEEFKKSGTIYELG